ncbi:hypothetical protein CVD25_06510 [Bacillus canaveralius]|uniref:Uncharacterized protein n=1 Tax=Bacillus canaveralius TaxID=1403243 RepID=A0A2N5GG12_9BACI|nr:hypothetical protein [Bacillus canaveralius]PLR79698.1 hypothetical protein CU635_21635 [Bacillus canaveralius]PLR99170.1 hypothetical protein CVD25_06510 [Bacillus canaveralius]
MQIDTTSLLAKLKKEKLTLDSTIEEYNSLVLEQVHFLKGLISSYEPVYEWFKKEEIEFAHPEISIRTFIGPILGCDEDELELFVFDVNAKSVAKVYVNDPDDKENYNLSKLVREGYFLQAVEGLMYLESTLSQYNKHNKEVVEAARKELNKVQ